MQNLHRNFLHEKFYIRSNHSNRTVNHLHENMVLHLKYLTATDHSILNTESRQYFHFSLVVVYIHSYLDIHLYASIMLG